MRFRNRERVTCLWYHFQFSPKSPYCMQLGDTVRLRWSHFFANKTHVGISKFSNFNRIEFCGSYAAIRSLQVDWNRLGNRLNDALPMMSKAGVIGFGLKISTKSPFASSKWKALTGHGKKSSRSPVFISRLRKTFGFASNAIQAGQISTTHIILCGNLILSDSENALPSECPTVSGRSNFS